MSKEIQTVQGSPEWFKLRRGIPTGSEFGRIVTPAKGDYAKGADGYAAELIAESLGWYRSFQGSPDTERGHRLEKEALRWLRLHHGIKSRPAGFLLSDCGRYGCSPDAITDNGEPVEVKCPDTHTFIKWVIAGGIPDEHRVQLHGEIILTGADCCHFVAYSENQYLNGIYIRVERDEFTDKLQAALLKFCDRLDQLRRELTGDEYEVLFPNANSPSVGAKEK
jgi:hypothetical protein